jgi:hypothetical protein
VGLQRSFLQFTSIAETYEVNSWWSRKNSYVSMKKMN